METPEAVRTVKTSSLAHGPRTREHEKGRGGPGPCLAHTQVNLRMIDRLQCKSQYHETSGTKWRKMFYGAEVANIP